MLRRDGEQTRKRILEAALNVFGEKGYRDATNAEVCEAAGANIAAVNYHFRTKEQLYREVCEHAIASMKALYPPGGTAAPDAPPEVRLRAHIEALILRSRVGGALRYYHNIRMTETFSPTGLVDDLWDGWFELHREISAAIVTEMLGEGATGGDVMRCQMSLMSQCYIANSSCTGGKFQTMAAPHLDDAGAVIEHIYQFTLGGIRALAREIKGRSATACP